MKFKILLLILVFAFSFNALFAQNITNVTSEQEGCKIVVRYKISKAKFNQKFNVLLYVSFDGGKTFQGPMKSVTGNVFKEVKEGANQMVWNPFNDVTSMDGDVVFDVKAEIINQKVEKHFFIHYTGSYSLRNSGYTAPFGISIGQIGKVGWYISARMNRNAFKSSAYDFNGNNVVDYGKALYYEYDNDYKYPSFEALAGITAQIRWNIFLYGGVGYAYQKYYGHINEYDFVTNDLQSDSYIDYIDYSASGIAAEGGVIIRAKSLSFNVGYSTLNFSYSNIVFGVGLNF